MNDFTKQMNEYRRTFWKRDGLSEEEIEKELMWRELNKLPSEQNHSDVIKRLLNESRDKE